MIPARVALALQSDGWWLRQDIIWSKPNPMPESVTDRCTKSHEYVFLLTKAARYYYDAEAVKEGAIGCNGGAPVKVHDEMAQGRHGATSALNRPWDGQPTRNRRSVWTIATQPYPGAHFATFPPDLVRPCILAGTSERGCCPVCGKPWERVVERGEIIATGGKSQHYFDVRMDDRELKPHDYAMLAHSRVTLGFRPTCPHDLPPVPCTVLDPFAGSGTTGMVAAQLGRHSIGIELKQAYISDHCVPRIQAALDQPPLPVEERPPVPEVEQPRLL